MHFVFHTDTDEHVCLFADGNWAQVSEWTTGWRKREMITFTLLVYDNMNSSFSSSFRSNWILVPILQHLPRFMEKTNGNNDNYNLSLIHYFLTEKELLLLALKSKRVTKTIKRSITQFGSAFRININAIFVHTGHTEERELVWLKQINSIRRIFRFGAFIVDVFVRWGESLLLLDHGIIDAQITQNQKVVKHHIQRDSCFVCVCCCWFCLSTLWSSQSGSWCERKCAATR